MAKTLRQQNFAFSGLTQAIPTSGSQSEHRIRLILPARGASHIINSLLACLGNQSEHRIRFILPTHRASHIIKLGNEQQEVGI